MGELNKEQPFWEDPPHIQPKVPSSARCTRLSLSACNAPANKEATTLPKSCGSSTEASGSVWQSELQWRCLY